MTTDYSNVASGTLANAHDFNINQPTMIENLRIDTQVNVTKYQKDKLSPIKKTAPCTSGSFTGQEQYLEVLKKHFTFENPGNLARKSFLLYGMGGIGKTQICLKFKDEMEDYFDIVFWIDATSEETVIQSFKDIYKSHSAVQNFGFSAASVGSWVSTLKNKWLMIFDNADGGPEAVEKFLPPGNKGNILITSRNQGLRKITTHENSMEVKEMGQATAIQLLLKASGLDFHSSWYQDLAREIVSELHYLPLAIDQAGAYIITGTCSIHEFLNIYMTQRTILLDNKTFKGASKYERSVYGTWEISFQKLVRLSVDASDDDTARAAKCAINTIQICAFLHHENIPESFFERAAENYTSTVGIYSHPRFPVLLETMEKELFNVNEDGHWNKLVFQQGIQMLISFSLIKKHMDENFYVLHPMVQYWCQDRLPVTERNMWISNSRGILTASIGQWDSNEEYMFSQTLILHVLQNLKHERNLDDLIYYDDMFQRFSMLLKRAEKYKIKQKLDTQILKMKLEVMGTEHPVTLSCMSDLATTYTSQKKWKEAVELEQHIVEISTRIFGEKHYDTVMYKANLANTYYYQGRLKESVKLDEQVLEILVEIFGEDHSGTAHIMSNLADMYSYQGRWKEAEKLGKQALEVRTRILGEKHFDTLTSMSNLAITCSRMGKLNEGKNLLAHVLKLRIRVFGKEHPETLKSMGNLATVYSMLKKWQEAEKLSTQIVEKMITVLGEEHPDTLTSKSGLANIYLNEGRLNEALELETNVLEINTRVLGKEHPNTIESMALLARIYFKDGSLNKAEKLGMKALEISVRILGEEHPDTLSSMIKLAITYFHLGKWNEADKLQNQALEMMTMIIGREHPITLESLHDLSCAYWKYKELTKAEMLMKEAVIGRKNIFGAESETALESVQMLQKIQREIAEEKQQKNLELEGAETRVTKKVSKGMKQRFLNIFKK